ncbi:MAG TPA: ADP-ribosyltransferase [Verrucomicrobiota bacterium]|jgi:hypothetical protein|nr:ADP-ribosyltransferase [Verrucomicrobiota bacterium]
MNGFRLLGDFLPEERNALAEYKDFSDNLNAALRTGNLTDELTRRRDALDSALTKGVSTDSLALYRATCATYFPTEVGAEFTDRAFVSTSLNPEGLVSFYCAEAPAKVLIQYPANRPLACFEYDEGGGAENERLLPRDIRFRVLSHREVVDRAAILQEQCTAFDRGQLYLRTGAKLVVLELAIVL